MGAPSAALELRRVLPHHHQLYLQYPVDQHQIAFKHTHVQGRSEINSVQGLQAGCFREEECSVTKVRTVTRSQQVAIQHTNTRFK